MWRLPTYSSCFENVHCSYMKWIDFKYRISMLKRLCSSCYHYSQYSYHCDLTHLVNVNCVHTKIGSDFYEVSTILHKRISASFNGCLLNFKKFKSLSNTFYGKRKQLWSWIPTKILLSIFGAGNHDIKWHVNWCWTISRSGRSQRLTRARPSRHTLCHSPPTRCSIQVNSLQRV